MNLLTFFFWDLITFHEINHHWQKKTPITFSSSSYLLEGCFNGLPVSYPSLMEIMHGRYKLSEEVSGPLLRQTELFLGPDKRHQVSTQSALQDQTVQGGGLQKRRRNEGRYVIADHARLFINRIKLLRNNYQKFHHFLTLWTVEYMYYTQTSKIQFSVFQNFIKIVLH